MVRTYTWTLRARSYEADPWGHVPASGLLRYLEQSAIDAAVDAGYGARFHQENNSTWVIRRMLLRIHAPTRSSDELEITTWLPNIERFRGGREYRVTNSATGILVADALAEWVYLDRTTFRPLRIPDDLLANFEVPGAPLGTYDPPIPLNAQPSALSPQPFQMERTVRWHDCDQHEHVNNSIYADWLDEAVRVAMSERGYGPSTLNEQGLQFRGEYYSLDYKRAALPEERLAITTRFIRAEGRLCEVEQSIRTPDGSDSLTARSVYGWQDKLGQPVEPPAWADIILSAGQ